MSVALVNMYFVVTYWYESTTKPLIKYISRNARLGNGTYYINIYEV